MNTILNSKHNRKKNTEHKKTRNQFYKRIDKKKKSVLNKIMTTHEQYIKYDFNNLQFQ